jgi:TonB family protein
MIKALAWLLLAALPALAQGWTPIHIVAIAEYPPLARVARVYGTVEIKCVLDNNGSVVKAEAVSGPPLLQEQARQNALLWRFDKTSPDEKGDTITLKYIYSFEGEADARSTAATTIDLPDTIRVVAHSPVPIIDYPAEVTPAHR